MIDVLGNALSRVERSDLAFAQFGTCAQCCTRQVPAFGSLRVFETWLPSAEIFEFVALGTKLLRCGSFLAAAPGEETEAGDMEIGLSKS